MEAAGPRHPGEILQRAFMDPLHLTAYRVAKETGIAPIALSQILRGTRSLSAVTALKLGAYFGTGPVFWWKLQALRDLLASESNGAAGGVDRCTAMAELEAVVKELAGPTGCWRSVRCEVRLQKASATRNRKRGAVKAPEEATDAASAESDRAKKAEAGKASVTDAAAKSAKQTAAKPGKTI